MSYSVTLQGFKTKLTLIKNQTETPQQTIVRNAHSSKCYTLNKIKKLETFKVVLELAVGTDFLQIFSGPVTKIKNIKTDSTKILRLFRGKRY
jgi:hypothetical protein